MQIVTQALHIPPQNDVVNEPIEELNEANANEVERLKRDMRKLRDYLKTSVQERKMLVKKIGTLNDRVAAAHVRKSVSPEKSTMTDSPRVDMSFEDKSFEELGIQCSLHDEGNPEDSNFVHFASELKSEVLSQNANTSLPSIVNTLNISQEAVSRLESILLEDEDCKEKLINLLENLESTSDTETRNCYRLNVTNVTNCYKRRSYIEPDQYDEKSRMSSEYLQDESITRDQQLVQDGDTAQMKAINPTEVQSCSSMASSLPDPNMIDLLELSFDNASTALQGIAVDSINGCALTPESPYPSSLQGDDANTNISRLNQDLERRKRDLENKAIMLDALEDQNQEKDKIIRDQAGVLEEYRMEILRLRDERREFNSGRASGQQYQQQTKKRHLRKTLSNELQQVRTVITY